ncbi:hypothetical protein LJC15_04605 [Desulfovibrio sp. OttesenSCG-928-G11]|nr:hypothetical protein [Desulfovibrio sp. OttesenSCG-928-G11]
MKAPRCCLLLICLLALCACMPKQPQVPPPPPPPAEEEGPPDEAAAIWQSFSRRAATAEIMSGPFRISGALRYTDPEGKSNRVSSLLWGNNQPDNPWPLRLDLTAGVGQVVAKAREGKSSFLAYIPDENTAYAHEGARRTLASFGVPVPLALSDLALLLTGRGGNLFLPEPRSGPGSKKDAAGAAEYPPERELTARGARFTLADAPLPGILELSRQGAPLEWREKARDGWRMLFEPAEDNPLRPVKLRVSHNLGWEALITVKDIARVSPPYSGAQLDLPLPPGTEKLPLPQ